MSFSITKYSVTTLSMMIFSFTINNNDIQTNGSVVMLSVIYVEFPIIPLCWVSFMLNVIIPSVVTPFQEKLSLLAILENDGTLTSCAPFHKLFTNVIYRCRMAKKCL
jgi:hypothetical protein